MNHVGGISKVVPSIGDDVPKFKMLSGPDKWIEPLQKDIAINMV